MIIANVYSYKLISKIENLINSMDALYVSFQIHPPPCFENSGLTLKQIALKYGYFCPL